MAPVSGHVYRCEGKRRPVWRAKYRLPDGRQVKKTIGPAWTERGRPPAGYFTKRTAEAWLRDVLDQARAGTLPGMVAHRRDVRRRLRGVAALRRARPRPQAVDAAPLPLERPRAPRAGVRRRCGSRTSPPSGSRPGRPRCGMSNRTKNKLLTELNGIFVRARRVYRLPHNPVADVEKPRTRSSTAIEVFSPEEVWALVRAAESEQDAAIFLTAAFTGLRRGELVALRWRDVDFAAQRVRVCGSFAGGRLTTPEERQGPLGPDGARRRQRARAARRPRATGPATTTSSSPASPAATSTPRRSHAATRPRSRRAGAAAAALPRPAPHVRHADDRQGRHPPRAGVDGPRRRRDDDEVPALRRAPRRGRARGRRVRHRVAGPGSRRPHTTDTVDFGPP